MQKVTEGFKPEDIIEIIIRHRWWIIIPFCLSMITGIYLAFNLPKIYRSETVIMIQPQKVPANFVRSVITADINTRINSISNEILSRTNIEKLIDEFNLFSGEEYDGMYMEDKIDEMKGKIGVRVRSAGRNKNANAFSISVEDKDPQKTMQLTNALAKYFIDENLKLREAQSVGTKEFIDNERSSMGKQLEEVDKRLRAYRQRHMGELPEQLETNLRILDRLQVDMNERQQRLYRKKNRLDLIISGKIGQDGERSFKTLEQLKEELYNLKMKYTDQHPDVIRLKSQIAKIEEGTITENLNEESTVSSPLPKTSDLYRASLLQRQREKTENEIKDLETEIIELVNKIQLYQKRVEDTPNIDYELSYLARDYRNIRDAYNSLLKKKLEAEIAINMEKQQKGEQFRILDQARLPQKPISPDEKRLFLISLASGLGIGLGLIFLLEFIDTSFRKPEDIESALGFPVLATLPLICHPKDNRRQRLNQIFSIFSIMLSLIFLTVFAALTYYGIDNTMEVINRFIAI